VVISENDPIVQLKHPEFDPFNATAEDLLALVDDLLAQSSPIH
jgi:hypothetical protein